MTHHIHRAGALVAASLAACVTAGQVSAILHDQAAAEADPEKRQSLLHLADCVDSGVDPTDGIALNACVRPKFVAWIRERAERETDPEARADRLLRVECIDKHYGDESATTGCYERGRAAVTGSKEAAATPVAKPAPTRGIVIAVFDIDDAGRRLDASTLDQLTEYLATRLAELGGYRVVPRDQVRARLVDEKAMSYGACVDESCQIELGKALAAEKSLSTRILRVGDVCAMTSTLYDLKTETTERAASTKTPCEPGTLLGGVDSVAQQLTQ